LDYDICSRDVTGTQGSAQRKTFLKSLLDLDEKSELARKLDINEYVPCTPDYASAYLNKPGVKAALHVKDYILWSDCSDPVFKEYNRTDSRKTSTAPIYNFLIDHPHDLNILVYSGDDDAVCATIGTQKWIWNLGYEAPHIMWSEYLHDNQLGGYYTTWDKTNLTFLTVHNAGHEVSFQLCVVDIYLSHVADFLFCFVIGASISASCSFGYVE
jgi:hypothetical protein